MNAPAAMLADEAARIAAMTAHDRSLLVEAGAGSGKTAVMAGRIALLLAAGSEPGSIVAVTFTELAASELLARVRDFVEALLAGEVPMELRPALRDGLSGGQREALENACHRLEEITCSTIHGFCQRLIKPYPVEANIDPGATLLDPIEADLLFDEVVEDWLRENLGGGEDTLLAELVYRSPAKAVALVQRAAAVLRRHRHACAPSADPVLPLVDVFRNAAAEFRSFVGAAAAAEEDTVRIAECFSGMADVIADAAAVGEPAALVRILTSEAHPDLCTAAGSFRKYQKKGKWQAAAKAAGLSKTDGDGLSARADALNSACCESWSRLLEAAAGQVLHHLLDLARPIAERYRERKRTAARLDFDDLIVAARDLLRGFPEVRAALAQRFRHLLVDEFQDTDPDQTEIFWRICGDPTVSGEGDWRSFVIRPGALFLVGDPKQAIYRFRGADVAAYVQARDAFTRANPQDVLSISTNFRSCGSILTFVNERFEPHLSADGQPGFTSLEAFHSDWEPGPCVGALDVACANEEGTASSEVQRDCEAEAVAELCARLIGSHSVADRRGGGRRPCRPGDIALLAPTGAELWRYEEALERHGVPVATQAGKGLYRRQETQDLIAITRVLADGRDRLALAALLRGPLVGLTEEELLDLVWTQPRDPEQPDIPARLSVNLDRETIEHPLAKDVIAKLQLLRMRINSTTPYQLLSEAVDTLRVRPLLVQRHGAQSERPLANVDLFLSLARPYAGRGLRAFSDAMRSAWEDGSRAPEGRPDAQEEAVALYTIHASKGLEWPVVMPINTMTKVTSFEEPIVERASGRVFMPVMGVAPPGYSEARDAELRELERERERLWYVAATRARELLVLPRLDVGPGKGSWGQLVDLRLSEVTAIDASALPIGFDPAEADPPNGQTRDVFVGEASALVAATRPLAWLAPSRDEDPAGPLAAVFEPVIAADFEGPAAAALAVQGGRLRGLVIHKLLEEVLSGELAEEADAVRKRAGVLIRELGAVPAEDASVGPNPSELASCVGRALALPEIAAAKGRLVPELPVYALEEEDSLAVHGVADAVAVGEGGIATLVVDWKTDVAPDQEAVEHYRRQVDSYRKLVGAPRGLVVFVTSGRVEAVEG
jgi:exodeoxyribonuclease-5